VKLVSWNCNMALRKKWSKLVELDADIYVIQECAQGDIQAIEASSGMQCFWMGANKHKGLGLLVRKPFKAEAFEDTGLTWIGSVGISGPETFRLYPVWTGISKQDRSLRYIRQIHLLINRLEQGNVSGSTVIIGDFNSNTIWDKEHGDRSHSRAVERLMALGISSSYHLNASVEQGSENKIAPTIYFRKNRAKPYHIDYCFASQDLQERLVSVEFGRHDDWISNSDHMPLSVVFMPLN